MARTREGRGSGGCGGGSSVGGRRLPEHWGWWPETGRLGRGSGGGGGGGSRDRARNPSVRPSRGHASSVKSRRGVLTNEASDIRRRAQGLARSPASLAVYKQASLASRRSFLVKGSIAASLLHPPNHPPYLAPLSVLHVTHPVAPQLPQPAPSHYPYLTHSS
jgi:hypothetical protein